MDRSYGRAAGGGESGAAAVFFSPQPMHRHVYFVYLCVANAHQQRVACAK